MFSLLTKAFVFFFAWIVIISPVFAALQTTSMLVSVDVMPGCVIAASPLVFGLYNPNNAISTTSTARLKLLCTLNTPYTIALDQGAGRMATTRLRTLSGPGTEAIRYILSQNPTHTLNWGNTVGVDTALGKGSGILQYVTVYGEIAPKQNVGIGSYRDVVNVSIIF